VSRKQIQSIRSNRLKKLKYGSKSIVLIILAAIDFQVNHYISHYFFIIHLNKKNISQDDAYNYVYDL